MEAESFILLDTNICIYRTLALIQPPIYLRGELDKVIEKIDTLSNNNLKCKIIISELIASELKNESILFSEVSKFCIEKLHVQGYNLLIIFNQAKKSMEKFILKYQMESDLCEEIKGYSANLINIDEFYLAFPSRLHELTQLKLNNLSPRQKQIKLNQRPQNLPEATDRKLLGQAVEIKKIYDLEVYLFSNDRDFTDFSEEITAQLGVNILEINGAICDSPTR